MRKGTKLGVLIFFLILLSLFVMYFLLAFYYRGGFCLNTWINGVYCTGKTVDEVNVELTAHMKPPTVIVTDVNGDSFRLNLEQMGYEGDFLPVLHKYLEEQNPFLWIDNITFHKNHTLAPASAYDAEQLRTAFESAEPIEREIQRRKEYQIFWNKAEDGYQLYDGLKDRLDVEKAFQTLCDAIDVGEYEINLADAECYYDIPFTEEQEQTKLLWEKIDAFQHCSLLYDMGDQQISLKPADLAYCLKAENEIPVTDEYGRLVLEEDGVKKFVASLAERYDTYGGEREFQSTRGDIVTVKGGTYGTKLDQKAEIQFLMESLLLPEMHGEESRIHIPKYEREAWARGINDIGDTYIEVDMTDQKMYYYVEGELKLETEVVTGNTGRKWDTPEGTNFVYGKQKNRVLRGANYATPVKYWMPVNGNIGIHDANWRNKFGGEIYKTDGSHGCINTPPKKMADLYDMVEIGTPVVMFY